MHEIKYCLLLGWNLITPRGQCDQTVYVLSMGSMHEYRELYKFCLYCSPKREHLYL